MQEKQGYVYILSNPAMPGVLKIGRSKHSGRIRARDIYKHGGTGVPMPFKMEFEVWSEDCIECELYVHEELQDYRINPSREFFKVDIKKAVKHVADVVLSAYELTVGNEDSTLTKDLLVPSYYKTMGLCERLFPSRPFEVELADTIELHLELSDIENAMKRRKRKVEKRKIERELKGA